MLGTAGLWVRSAKHFDRYTRMTTDFSFLMAENYYGRIGLLSYSAKEPATPPFLIMARRSRVRWETEIFSFYGWWSWFDFKSSKSQLASTWHFTFPHWFLLLLSAVLPSIWLIKWWKKRRLAMVGCCPACGYDLTGNETGVCPECGASTAIETTRWETD